MFKPLLTRFFQTIFSQNKWAYVHLAPHCGKNILLTVSSLEIRLTILEDGSLASGGETAEPDATISIPLNTTFKLLAKDPSASSEIQLSGDTQLASDLGKVLSNLNWDIEEDLSKVIGDVPANMIVEFGRKVSKETKSKISNITDMLAEYLQEEYPLVAKKRNVDAFNINVDILRNDVERLEKRLSKISAHVADMTDLVIKKKNV